MRAWCPILIKAPVQLLCELEFVDTLPFTQSQRNPAYLEAGNKKYPSEGEHPQGSREAVEAVDAEGTLRVGVAHILVANADDDQT